KTFKNLNNELETKQTISKKLQLEIQQKKIEIQQLKEGLEDVKFQGLELLQLAQKKEQKTTTNLKQEAEKLKSKINLLDKKILNVTKLLEIYQNTNFSTQIEENCLAIIESLQNLFPAQTYLLFLLDEVNAKKILFPEVSATPYLEYFKNLTFQLGEGAVGWVAENLKPLKIDQGEILIENLELNSLILNEPSVLIAPLFFQNELYGVLYLGGKEKQAFSDEDLEFFSLFAKLASITLSFAYRFHYTIAGGITDDLTGLYNNFYFKERLNEELKRAKRYNFNLGLILINIDHLKKYNDTYGMPVGDLILKEFSEVLKVQARETDVIARLDKDNFAVILVQTEKKGAILIAERIRMAVGLRIFAKPLDKKININISLGITNFPQDVKSEEELYNLALQMLKEAKGKGGNQLIFSA
ncbi:MAG: sensor domain-containing diguanylate cyclase, partial [Armatimonadetes bacterium]|nr:sensor domain-containing diguanylate cyclase [Armatimonadota bacterium]